MHFLNKKVWLNLIAEYIIKKKKVDGKPLTPTIPKPFPNSLFTPLLPLKNFFHPPNGAKL